MRNHEDYYVHEGNILNLFYLPSSTLKNRLCKFKKALLNNSISTARIQNCPSTAVFGRGANNYVQHR